MNSPLAVSARETSTKKAAIEDFDRRSPFT
jgi:hypothetical protein